MAEVGAEGTGEPLSDADESPDVGAESADAGDRERLVGEPAPSDHSTLIRRLLDQPSPEVPLEPGTPVFLDLFDASPARYGTTDKYKSRVLGYRHGHVILCEAPMVGKRRARGYIGQGVVGRFIHEGVAYGFRSQLVHMVPPPYHVWILRFPQDVEAVELRHNRRFRMMIPCELVADDERRKGVIRDLSVGGALVFCDEPFDTGRKVSIGFGPVCGHSVVNVEAVVQNNRRGQGGVQIGVRFESPDDAPPEKIRDFLDALLNGGAAVPGVE